MSADARGALEKRRGQLKCLRMKAVYSGVGDNGSGGPTTANCQAKAPAPQTVVPMLKTLAEYETLAAQAHGHLCAGQILGLRMALHGVQLLGLSDPEGA